MDLLNEVISPELVHQVLFMHKAKINPNLFHHPLGEMITSVRELDIISFNLIQKNQCNVCDNC
jgi:hypothetical protein